MVLDINKYITIEENGKAGQTSGGVWYCKEIPFSDDIDLKDKINKINKVLNEANKDVGKKN